MKIFVIGGGGREHALVWNLSEGAGVEKVFCAPGNAGISAIAECVDGDPGDVSALADLAEKLGADLTVVGPELPLTLGISDEFEKRGLNLLGPSQAAAQLEGSKAFSKQFMRKHGIPTADFEVCENNTAAYTALCAVEWPCVIKADGLAAGKGVRIVEDPDQATATVDEFMQDKVLGDAGTKLVIEECLEGEELSFIVLTDGETVLPFPPSQDHKRAFDNDEGPNTGGMGAYSHDAMMDDALRQRILQEIVEPTIAGLKAVGRPYRGFLYFGLMLTAEGPKLLEYNCRMGDPECQPLLMRLESDLAEVLGKTAAGDLAGTELQWKEKASACVVLASGGYPGKYEKGEPITGLDEAAAVDGVTVFHAGTKKEGDEFVTAGGRVLGVTATGNDLQQALDRCYEAAGIIQFEGCHYRRDIGARGLKKVQAGTR
jgi:phosphoribosylamine--glycine ligase